MQPQLSKWEKFKLILLLSKIDDPNARQAYIEHRRGNIQFMLTLFMLSKVIHIVHIASIYTDLDNFSDYRAENPIIAKNYSAEPLDDLDKDLDEIRTIEDEGKKQFEQDCIWVIVQYALVSLALIIAIFIVRKTNVYIHLLAWIVCLSQLLELPLKPVLPQWYLLMIAAWILASYFFLTVLSFQTLYQAIPLLVIMLIGLPVRLYMLIDTEQMSMTYLVIFGLLTFAIAIMISIDVVSSTKLVFKQLFEMHRQKECFRTIMSSFPEGVLIAKVTKLSHEQARQQQRQLKQTSKVDDVDETVRGLNYNQEPVVSNADYNEDDGGQDGSFHAPHIRVDVLFMNQHLQKFLSSSRSKDKFNPQERLEVKKVVPFQFYTRQYIQSQKTQRALSKDGGLGNTLNTVTQDFELQEAVSLGDLLREGWQGRRFFKIKTNSKSEEVDEFDQKNSVRTVMDTRDILLEICIKPREFCDMDCKLLIIRNISHVARQEKLQSEFEYQQALIQTRQHEDLTPLNAILNMSEMLIEDSKNISEEQKEFIQIIWSSGKLLEFNIQSQLSQMQIEQDNLEINYVRCTRPMLQEWILDVLKPFKMVIKERNLNCQVHISSSVPAVILLEKKLYSEILYNLFQNAVKYNKLNGSINTNVRYDRILNKLFTSVEDTGVGISSKKKQDLFIPFRMSTTNRNKNALGVGIGLSNSKSLVDALNGHIDVQSKPDKGTVVLFSVDVSVKHERTEEENKARVNAAKDAGLGKQANLLSENEVLNSEDLAPQTSMDMAFAKNALEETKNNNKEVQNRDLRQKQRAQQRYKESLQTVELQDIKIADQPYNGKKGKDSTDSPTERQPNKRNGDNLLIHPSESQEDFVEKPGQFLPMINNKRQMKKKPTVGLFGDYVDGEDAMLVYDVDSDAEEDNSLTKEKTSSAPQKQHQKKDEAVGESSNVEQERANLDKNIVLPKDNMDQDDETKTLDNAASSVSKFRVKKALDLPQDVESEIKEVKKMVKFESDSEEGSHSRPGSGISSNLFDDALIASVGNGVNCGCSATVLLVDDSEYNLLPLNMMLQTTYKIKTVKATNGAQAVEIMQKDRQKKCCKVRIRIILMDLVMPVLDGISATVQIMDILNQERALKCLNNLKQDGSSYSQAEKAQQLGVAIAAVTAYIDQSTVDKVFDVGMIQAIQKPVRSEQLAKLIAKYHQ